MEKIVWVIEQINNLSINPVSIILIFYLISTSLNFMNMALCCCGKHIYGKGLLCSFLPIGIAGMVYHKWEVKKNV